MALRNDGFRWNWARKAVAALAGTLVAACGASHGTPSTNIPRRFEAQPRSTGAWYSVQLHSHSTYSDGAYGVKTMIAMAKAGGLDALAISDHDCTTQWLDPDFVGETGVVMLHAQEAEDDHGINHLGVLGMQGILPIKPTLPRDGILSQATARHATIVINHPQNNQDPWTPLVFDERASAIEVWNSFYWSPLEAPKVVGEPCQLQNEAGIAWWSMLLEDGHHIAPVAGADFHRKPQSLVSPVTLVYAETRTETAILAAIRAGRTGLAHDPRSARVEMTADGDGDGVFEGRVGDTVKPDSLLHMQVKGGRGKHLRLMRGDVCLLDTNVTSDDWSRDFKLEPAGASFVYARLNGMLSTLEAMTAPIYLK
jgi:hypothetical protein